MTRKRKKPFARPRVTRVKLTPREAVLNGCKVTGVLAPSGVFDMLWCAELSACELEGS